MAEDHVIISRAEAKARGLKRYFTGRACRRNHFFERRVSGKQCLMCFNEDSLRRRRKDLEKARLATRNSMKKLRDSDPGKSRLKQQERYWQNPNYARALARKAYNKHAVSRRVEKKLWRIANPELQKARAKESYVRYTDKYRAWGRNRKARKRQAPGSHTTADLAAILKAQNNCCAYCRADLREVKRHVDHIMPLVRGGSNDKTNLQFTCISCNLKKSAKDPIAFAQELGRLL